MIEKQIDLLKANPKQRATYIEAKRQKAIHVTGKKPQFPYKPDYKLMWLNALIRDYEGTKNKTKGWSPDDVTLLKKHFPVSPRENLLDMFAPKSWNSISNKAHRLGLYRNKL